MDLADTHQDERGLWIKSPIKTRVDEKRLVDKPDTTLTAGKSLNDVIEDYCKGGFEEDNKVGSRTSKSCQIWLRYMAGYNNRQLFFSPIKDYSNNYPIIEKVNGAHIRFELEWFTCFNCKFIFEVFIIFN